jgi:FixJ family two-component response regulator
MATRSLISVVDDDESVRESLPVLLRMFGFPVQVFASAEAFLASGYLDETKCLILDVAMPGMSGPDLQEELMRRGRQIPIVFITAYENAAVRRLVLQRGAVGCLSKPFSEKALLEAMKCCLPAS